MKCISNWVWVFFFCYFFFYETVHAKPINLAKEHFFCFLHGSNAIHCDFTHRSYETLLNWTIKRKRKHETLTYHRNCLICFCISWAFSCWHFWGREVRNEWWWLLRPSVNSSWIYLFTIPPPQTVSCPLKVIFKTLWTHWVGFFYGWYFQVNVK